MSDQSLPLVSIITPTYNRAGYLPETIDSVLGQDYPNIEYIVLDDGSTDNTPDILAQYEERIQWHRHPNMGEARTVNRGWEMATGEYIVTVNSDDPLLPGFVRTSVEFMEAHPEVLVGYPGWLKIDEHSRPIAEVKMYEYSYINMLRWHYCFPGPGAILRRKVFELEKQKRNPAYRYRSDYDYWLRVGLHGPFAYIPHVLATWRTHSGSASSSLRGNTQVAKEDVQVIEEIYRRPELPAKIQAARREALGMAHYIAALKCLPTERAAARYHFLRSLWYAPLNRFNYPPQVTRRWDLMAKTIFLTDGMQRFLRNIRALFRRQVVQ